MSQPSAFDPPAQVIKGNGLPGANQYAPPQGVPQPTAPPQGAPGPAAPSGIEGIIHGIIAMLAHKFAPRAIEDRGASIDKSVNAADPLGKQF